MNYEVVSQQIPASGTYSSATISGMSVITLDLEDNIEYLQGTIYAGTEYGSDTVITQDADDYGTTNTDDEDTDFLGTTVDAEEAVPKPSMVTKPRG
jgi:hypothetical protein